MSYISPIEIVTTQMRTNYEEGILKVVHDVGFFVKKEELEKALKYDRDQYNKGFSDGINCMLEIVADVKSDANKWYMSDMVDEIEKRGLALKGGQE